jgi:hypothetical protein
MKHTTQQPCKTRTQLVGLFTIRTHGDLGTLRHREELQVLSMSFEFAYAEERTKGLIKLPEGFIRCWSDRAGDTSCYLYPDPFTGAIRARSIIKLNVADLNSAAVVQRLANSDAADELELELEIDCEIEIKHLGPRKVSPRAPPKVGIGWSRASAPS